MTNAASEGDDLDRLASTTAAEAAPLRAVLFGNQFAGITTEGIPSISATGPHAVRLLAQQLLSAGFSGDRELILHRAGKRCNHLKSDSLPIILCHPVLHLCLEI